MPHIHEQIDHTVSVYIVHIGKVLLVEHPRYGMWLPVGGHIELDQDNDEALFAEIKQESGLDVEIMADKPPGIPGAPNKFLYRPSFVDRHPANVPHEHIAYTYFARASSDQSVLSDEHTSMRWFSPEELTRPEYSLSPAVQFFCREALRTAETWQSPS